MSVMVIKNILLPLITFEVNENFDNSKRSDKNFDFNITVGNSYMEAERLLAVSVQVETPDTEDRIPFRFRVKAVGNFAFSTNPEPVLLENLKEISCPSIIFPYVRECIADMSRRAGVPPVHLPAISFIRQKKILK